MHAALAVFGQSQNLLSEAIRNYLIAITSAPETYYRDVYVFVLSQDETALRRVLPDVREKATLANLHALLAEGVAISR
jgi:hypothetical protein